MNFSKSVHPYHQGSFVWKRNANTSETKRKDTQNHKKIRITSESSEYSNLGETQPSINIKTNPPKSKNKKSEWMEIKTIAKYSTIASRMELKKSIPVSFLDFNDKKSPKREKNKSSFEYNTFDRIIDTQGNLTKSFKDTKEFKSLNPHISKDVDRMKKRVYSMYQQEKKKMNNFLGQSETTINDQNSETENCKSIGFLTNYNCSNEMQKISERQEHESKVNSTRIKEKKNEEYERKENEREENKRPSTKKRIEKNEEKNVPYFNKSTSKMINRSNPNDKSSSVLSKMQNSLLKGLVGEYSNYEKLSKHELIEKLISLEYLAQNIFKKNKFLQEEIEKKNLEIAQQKKTEIKRMNSKGTEPEKESVEITEMKNRNLFQIDNEDGYFNEFLSLEKEKEIDFQVEDNIERFNENQNNF